MPLVCRQVLHKWGDDGTPGGARRARRRPGRRQGIGLPHPPRKGTEVPVVRPLLPTLPQPRAPGNAAAPEEGEAAANAPPKGGTIAE